MSRKDKQVNIRLPRWMYVGLQALAKKKGRSVSGLVRAAVMRLIKDECPPEAVDEWLYGE